MHSTSTFETYNTLRRGLPLARIAELMSDRSFFNLLGLFDHELYVHSSRDHFDAVARAYLQYAADTDYMLQALQWQLQNLPPLLAKLDDLRFDRPIRIADFGAGIGAISSWPVLHDLLQLRGIQLKKDRLLINLFDISPEMKFLCRQLQLDNIPPPLRGPFGDTAGSILDRVRAARYNDYDIASLAPPCSHHTEQRLPAQHIVICSFVLHHLGMHGKYQALRNLANVLRNDGLLILIDEYRSFEQQQEYLSTLINHSAAQSSPIPYGLECFVDSDWFREALADSGIDLRVLAFTPPDPTSRLIGIIASKSR